MTKIALAFVTTVSLLAGAPLLVTTPANAQVDVQIGHDHDRDRDHVRGPGIVVGEPRHCHTVTITERHHDHVETRTVRKCD